MVGLALVCTRGDREHVTKGKGRKREGKGNQIREHPGRSSTSVPSEGLAWTSSNQDYHTSRDGLLLFRFFSS